VRKKKKGLTGPRRRQLSRATGGPKKGKKSAKPEGKGVETGVNHQLAEVGPKGKSKGKHLQIKSKKCKRSGEKKSNKTKDLKPGAAVCIGRKKNERHEGQSAIAVGKGRIGLKVAKGTFGSVLRQK